ncbi:putative acetolactate synthase small subunit [Oxobacter pfennigii]|uniref:Acetolactate synthase small subunit n=1 Tax=Oxobacter pfennigii TaxID=36849 RepID=A0A0N8NTD9_9CLOT|nr:acetolactate synthase small subunit [Oxobacter pfennigii]KPU44560.1 putative acetolactate synthase small subunit [Oxobacter pfennigii]
MKHILSVLVNDTPGVVTRVSALFSKRNYNIKSFVGCETHIPGTSTLIIVVYGDDEIIEQITKQLRKLIDVIEVSDITQKKHVSRELVLIRVKADTKVRSEIIQIVDIFRANIVDFQNSSLMIEATGDEDKIDALVEALKSFEILEIVKTGEISMVRKNV